MRSFWERNNSLIYYMNVIEMFRCILCFIVLFVSANEISVPELDTIYETHSRAE